MIFLLSNNNKNTTIYIDFLLKLFYNYTFKDNPL